MVPVLEKTVEAVYRDQDLVTVEKGMPGNLLLLRGMCESSPGNRDLWTMGAQLYFYYSMGFVEDEDPERAKLLYLQGLSMGRSQLDRLDWFRPDRDIDAFAKGLQKAEKDDVPLLFWTLANWVSWINLSMNEPAAIADLPVVEAALARVLELDPTFFRGMPYAFFGTLQATKPVLLGGKPEQARAAFEKAFETSGRRLLFFQALYAQSYCRQTLDQEGFRAVLQEVLDAPADLDPEYRLLNEVAKRRAKRLLEYEDDWF